MKEVHYFPIDRYGYDFIPPEFVPAGKDEYWLRNKQVQAENKHWRGLEASEIEILVKNNNYCSNWDNLLVSDPFDARLIRDSQFYGLVRLGKLERLLIQHHDFRIPTGIRNSTIISCDIGDNCAIQDVRYLSHYIIGDAVILSRIDEMQCTNHAKFGNGILTDGEEESVRIWIDVMNEAGGRSILPFEDLIPADAYLWASYRDDARLVQRLAEITQAQYGAPRGRYGMVGPATVIKSCRIIKDVYIGSCAYIKGANKLKNLSILSSEAEPSQIGEGVELVNGIVGYGCRVFYGCKAVRFVMGRNSALKYGARLIHSVLGDNSTVSCCEILNNLIFPFHEQHHNNSFLIASLVQGQSNIAAGATIGSNHNSRANDGELRAGRGFWPGLCVSLKHPSRFASFIIIAKGSYPYELHIPLPFSLVNNNVSRDELEVMPAYYWMYNLYALERNSWKFRMRDKRVTPVQRIETEYLAPDTASEILNAMELLELWVGRAYRAAQGKDSPRPERGGTAKGGSLSTDEELRALGRRLLLEEPAVVDSLDVLGEGLERSSRPCRILKVRQAYEAYRDMLRYYCIKTLVLSEPPAVKEAARRIFETKNLTLNSESGETTGNNFFLVAALSKVASTGGGASAELSSPAAWENFGGQLVPASRVDALRQAIREGRICSWDEIHATYEEWSRRYPEDRLSHAQHLLYILFERGLMASWVQDSTLQPGPLVEELKKVYALSQWMENEVRHSREKDYTDPFRAITYRNKEEMEAVLGRLEDNPFIGVFQEECRKFREILQRFIEKWSSSI
ncbi:MAG TPA: DUF4954 family protein [Termitinemataceae bacterium]|nr:DUF4954 family protein [Termitinemataceae bacterium]